MSSLRLVSLFSGVGGFEAGLTRALPDLETVAQCECDPFARGVLARHFPSVYCAPDVRTFHPAAGMTVICGGSPCQDLSNSGHRGGLAGLRSGLWKSYVRIVHETRPAAVVWENVQGALSVCRGSGDTMPAIGTVIQDLQAQDYEGEWHKVSAFTGGASHLRERVFLFAWQRGLRGREVRISRRFHEPRVAKRGREQFPEEPPRTVRSSKDVPYHKDRMRVLGNCVTPVQGQLAGIRLGEILRDPKAVREQHRALYIRNLVKLFDANKASYPSSGIFDATQVYGVPREAFPLACSLDACEGLDAPERVEKLHLWPTVTARDWRSGKIGPKTVARGNARPLSETLGDYVGVNWAERLLGFQNDWTLPEEDWRAKEIHRGTCG